MQGDIIEKCPVIRPPNDLSYPVPKQASLEIAEQSAVVVSQSCDLVKDQKRDMAQVILCPVWNLSDAEKVNNYLAGAKGKEECRRGNLAGYHMISACEEVDWKQQIRIVSFREILSLPLGFVRKVAIAQGVRLRLRPPYREHLAQAFARYFMRVGLPIDIPPFK